VTRAEVIAIVERVAAANGWHVHSFVDESDFEMLVDPRPGEEDDAGAGVNVLLDGDCDDPIGTVTPYFDFVEGEADCSRIVADWPLIQTMVATLREALGVQS